MTSLRSILLSAVAVSCLSVPVLADDKAPVLRSVVLSSAGLAEFTREIPASAFQDGHADVSFPVLSKDINDTLKSLLVSGQGLAGVEMRLPSASLVDDVFAGLPFAPQDLGAVDALLARLPGARVRLDIQNGIDEAGDPVIEVVEGRVMGVAQDAGCPSDTRCQPVVLIQTDAGAMERVALWDGVRVTLADAGDRAKVARGLDALASGAASGGAVIDLALSGTGASPVLVSTVLEAPMWKTSYRAAVAEDGSVALQAWATVENATQEDWVDVALSIVSGAPRTIAADLYARRYPSRESAPGDAESKILNQMQFAPPAADASGAGMAERMVLEAAPAQMVDYGTMGGMDTGVVASDQTAGARFDVPGLVSVAAGEVVSLPFLSGDVPARAVAYVEGGYGGYGGVGAWRPMALALDITNDREARLPEGVATIYADGMGFAGDSWFPAMEPGSRHMAPFLSDSGARVRTDQTASEEGVLISVRSGMVRLESTMVRTTSYTVRAPEQKGVQAVIDHPATAPGVTMEVIGGEAEAIVLGGARSVQRLQKPLEAAEEWSVSVVEREPVRSEWYVGDVDDTQLLAWSARAEDPDTKAWLEKAVALRAAVSEAERAFEESQTERADLVTNQARLSTMLQSLNEGTEAHTRFLNQILAIEDDLAALDASAQDRMTALEQARVAFDAHIAG